MSRLHDFVLLVRYPDKIAPIIYGPRQNCMDKVAHRLTMVYAYNVHVGLP